MAKSNAPPASHDTLDPLLSVAETAEALHCSEKTVRRLIARGELQAIRVGHLVRVCPKHLQRYKANNGT